MNLAQIENHLKLLVYTLDKETFIYNLLESYYLPKASISRLQKGNLNLSKVPGEVSWKKKLFFKEELNKDLHITISALKNEIKHNQRFIIVTDYETLLAVDTVTQDQLDIPIKELPKYYDFFLPWAGMEKATHAAENPADVKAAEKMAKLFDEIKKDNPDTSAEFNHNLNIFFSRLLFCYFAEDTNIFEDNQFSHAVESHTRGDGSDLDAYLNRLFWVLNTPVDKRGEIPHYLNAFPYVNGGLFKEEIPCPKFTSKSRQLLIDSGDSNDWSAINPDIFGSMFQAVISPEHRGGLLHRISKIKLFDPACGSGNFLIIAYKELRRLEMLILKELGGLAFSGIHLNNFYGIELDDFAHEIAKLSLWLAEHQMNVEFFNEFGRTNPTLPLQEAGQIVCGNACRLDWEKVCPKNEGDEIYIMGNPPYLGARLQSDIQKQDMRIVFGEINGVNNLDYISCWFFKASKYIIGNDSKFAFVTTNSISQGEQVSILWPLILNNGLIINFAHPSFKWSNNAKSNAGVTVSIIGVCNKKEGERYLFINGLINKVKHINSYLVSGNDVFIQKRMKSISNLPDMNFGSMANDGGFLIMSETEKNNIVNSFPQASNFIKRLIGSQELIQGTNRYCFWISQDNYTEAINIAPIHERIENCRKHRLKSERLATQELSKIPYSFSEIRYQPSNSIIIPRVSSERRKYHPIDFLNPDTIISDSALSIYNAQPFHFSIITSMIHMVWLRAVSGKLEDRIRYSSSIVYNTFPFPSISSLRKEELTQCTFRILEEREKHPEKTLAQLYDPDKMPEGLKEAHRLNDEAVERCYRSTPFNSDEERLEYLFKLYEKMVQEEKEKGTLFEAEKKTRKKK
jgi:hypothetical protein